MSDTIRQRKARHAAVRGGPRSPRLRRVFVQDLEVVASVGVYEHEKRYEQRVLISADLWVRDDYDGRSDRLGSAPAETPVTPADLHATVFRSLGIDPQTMIRDLDGRPFPICEGKALPLFG